MDTTEQRRVLDIIAQAAKAEGCLVAPVGSVYVLLAGTPRATTKDVDTVIHDADLQPPPLAVLARVAGPRGAGLFPQPCSRPRVLLGGWLATGGLSVLHIRAEE